MTAIDLRDAAIEIFGRRGWTSGLAESLGIDRTTVYRYINAQMPIPGPVDAAVKSWLTTYRRSGERPQAL